MAYHNGHKPQFVRPITDMRETSIRASVPQVAVGFLQKPGRGPLNHPGYPITAVPTRSADVAPTVRTWTPPGLLIAPGQHKTGTAPTPRPLGFGVQSTPPPLGFGAQVIYKPFGFQIAPGLHKPKKKKVQTPFAPYGQFRRTKRGKHKGWLKHPAIPDDKAVMRPLPFGPPIHENQKLGASLQVLPAGFTGFTSTYTPNSSAVPAPAQTESGGLFGGLASLVNLWNNRPAELKKIRIRLKPSQIMRTVQQVIPASTVENAVDRLREVGIDPRYLTGGQEIPVTGRMAGGGYYASGIDWEKYLPWVVGGAAALLVLPRIVRG